MDETIAQQIDHAMLKLAGLITSTRSPGRTQQIFQTFWELFGLWQRLRAPQLKS